jgi:GNAT superfamily N-acetyltransferase
MTFTGPVGLVAYPRPEQGDLHVLVRDRRGDTSSPGWLFVAAGHHGPLQGLGIATMLIGAGEQRVRVRGLAFAAFGVEDNNPRARHLYQRLGYQAAGRQHASCETEDDTGVLRVYETTLTILRKRL